MSEKRFKTKDVRTECFIIEDTNGNEIIELAEFKSYAQCKLVCDLLNEQQATINKQEEIIKSQDMEISRQYNLCLAMSGILREEFGVYDVFDRTKDKNIKKEDD